MTYLRENGKIDFRRCLARARFERRINDRVNQRCPDLAHYWGLRSRYQKVRSLMNPIRQFVAAEQESFGVPPTLVWAKPGEYADSFEQRAM